jgi:hypothetical protein
MLCELVCIQYSATGGVPAADNCQRREVKRFRFAAHVQQQRGVVEFTKKLGPEPGLRMNDMIVAVEKPVEIPGDCLLIGMQDGMLRRIAEAGLPEFPAAQGNDAPGTSVLLEKRL